MVHAKQNVQVLIEEVVNKGSSGSEGLLNSDTRKLASSRNRIMEEELRSVEEKRGGLPSVGTGQVQQGHEAEVFRDQGKVDVESPQPLCPAVVNLALTNLGTDEC
jgi:hypothetical protein